jgi:hypothetical protein
MKRSGKVFEIHGNVQAFPPANKIVYTLAKSKLILFALMLTAINVVAQKSGMPGMLLGNLEQVGK